MSFYLCFSCVCVNSVCWAIGDAVSGKVKVTLAHIHKHTATQLCTCACMRTHTWTQMYTCSCRPTQDSRYMKCIWTELQLSVSRVNLKPRSHLKDHKTPSPFSLTSLAGFGPVTLLVCLFICLGFVTKTTSMFVHSLPTFFLLQRSHVTYSAIKVSLYEILLPVTPFF